MQPRVRNMGIGRLLMFLSPAAQAVPPLLEQPADRCDSQSCFALALAAEAMPSATGFMSEPSASAPLA